MDHAARARRAGTGGPHEPRGGWPRGRRGRQQRGRSEAGGGEGGGQRRRHGRRLRGVQRGRVRGRGRQLLQGPHRGPPGGIR